MTRNQIVGIGVTAFWIIFAAQISAIMLANRKPNTIDKFDLSAERVVKDLNGRAVNLILNQVWPFDASQNINVQIIGKKQVDEYVVIMTDVKVLTDVQKTETPKEQFTTSKETKLPSKLQLTGTMKLTYELVGGNWYLVSMENVSLKVAPLD